MSVQVPGNEFDRISGTDEHGCVPVEPGKNLSRQRHGRVGYRHRAGTDLGIGAYFFRYCKSLLEKAIECRPGRSCGMSDPVSVLHLTENLRFTDDHRIQTAGDGKYMIDRAATLQRKQTVAVFPGEITGFGKPTGQCLDPVLPALAVELCPIAGRYNQRLLDIRNTDNLGQCEAELLDAESNLFADRHGCGPVIDAENVK